MLDSKKVGEQADKEKKDAPGDIPKKAETDIIIMKDKKDDKKDKDDKGKEEGKADEKKKYAMFSKKDG